MSLLGHQLAQDLPWIFFSPLRNRHLSSLLFTRIQCRDRFECSLRYGLHITLLQRLILWVVLASHLFSWAICGTSALGYLTTSSKAKSSANSLIRTHSGSPQGEGGGRELRP